MKPFGLKATFYIAVTLIFDFLVTMFLVLLIGKYILNPLVDPLVYRFIDGRYADTVSTVIFATIFYMIFKGFETISMKCLEKKNIIQRSRISREEGESFYETHC